jgi:hypothetical protein
MYRMYSKSHVKVGAIFEEHTGIETPYTLAFQMNEIWQNIVLRIVW